MIVTVNDLIERLRRLPTDVRKLRVMRLSEDWDMKPIAAVRVEESIRNGDNNWDDGYPSFYDEPDEMRERVVKIY